MCVYACAKLRVLLMLAEQHFAYTCLGGCMGVTVTSHWRLMLAVMGRLPSLSCHYAW